MPYGKQRPHLLVGTNVVHDPQKRTDSGRSDLIMEDVGEVNDKGVEPENPRARFLNSVKFAARSENCSSFETSSKIISGTRSPSLFRFLPKFCSRLAHGSVSTPCITGAIKIMKHPQTTFVGEMGRSPCWLMG